MIRQHIFLVWDLLFDFWFLILIYEFFKNVTVDESFQNIYASLQLWIINCRCQHQLWTSSSGVNVIVRYQSKIADFLSFRCCLSLHSHEANTIWQLRHSNDILHNVNFCKSSSWCNSFNAISRFTLHIL